MRDLALLAAALVAMAGPALAQPEAAAEAFARRFLAGEHAKNLPQLTEEMRAAFGPDAAERVRSQLLAANGSIERVGAAWLEDRVQGYRRLRVPVQFARATLDLRVVLDARDRIAGMFVVPHAKPPDAEDAPVEETELEVGPAGSALGGTLSLPPGDGPFPGAVLVHGSGPHDRDQAIGPNRTFRDLAWGLAVRGVAVLRYDKRSLARPLDLLAEGAALTVRHEVLDDARAALAVLRAHPKVDAARTWVVGHSLGGTLVPRIADMPRRPAGLVVLAGATLPLPEKTLEQHRTIAALDGEVSDAERARIAELEAQVKAIRRALDGSGPDPAGNVMGAPIGYYRDLEAHDPTVSAAALGLPVLVLQGERDYQVTDRDFARWQRALAGRPFACLVTYPGLDHLFRAGSGPPGPHDYDRAAPIEARVLDDVAGWIVERRCPRAASADG